VATAGCGPGHLVLDLGAGHGAVTAAVRATGARVRALELDRHRLTHLRHRFAGDAGVEVVRADLRRLRVPAEPHRVVANPPFDLTTPLARTLFDRPKRGPERVDLVLQRSAARRLADPTGPLSLGWSPWFAIGLGLEIPRRAFRPVPRVDAVVFVATRRPVPLLPVERAVAWRRFLSDHHARWAGPDRGLRWWLKRYRSR
jgi:23S rRNA (adenine-N6)-dimethyltransferase